MLTSLRRLGISLLAATAALSGANAQAPNDLVTRSLEERAASGDRLVFAHFMIGIVSDRSSPADYDDDMQRAKAAGIDAFALNIGTDPYTVTQLQLAYQSAANNGMKVFISFDFNWYSTSEGTAVGQMISQFAGSPAQLLIDGKAFVSSFAGDGVDPSAIRAAAGVPIFFVPNFHPPTDTSQLDGAFNWAAWDSNGRNKAPDASADVTVADGDASYLNWLQGKFYLAPASAWFSTHYGPEVSYSKNFVFPGGLLVFNRWQQILQSGFNAVEMITWNDYGESHYFAPLESPHTDDGASKWVNDMPHDGWLDLVKPFIAAFKNKDTNVANYVGSDQLVYWYRRNLNSINCDSTDTTMAPANNDSGNYFEGKPNGWQTLPDEVYVAALLKEPGTVTVVSGGQSTTMDLPAGVNAFSVPANLGQQVFTLSRSGSTVMTSTSLMDITDVCACGLYNYNAFVGTVPAPTSNDPLQPDGLASLTVGLHVSTCQPQPSLGTNPPSSPQPTQPAIGNPSGPSAIISPIPSLTSSGPGATPTGTCNGGTIAPGKSGNLLGLCSFACNAGYCPQGVCVCTSSGSPYQPASNGRSGCPLAGESDDYIGLCDFACNHGYCPDGACQYC